LDLPDAPYTVTAEAAQRVVAYIVADPFDLTRRARQVQDNLTGDDRLVLSADPSRLAQELKALPQLKEIRLWELPFEMLRQKLTLGPMAIRNDEVLAFEPFAVRPLLWKARMRHFQGRRHEAEAHEESESEASIDDHGEAARLYTSSEVRPADRDVEREASADKRRVDLAAKLNATYWLGLLSFDDGRYDVASHWFSRPELQAGSSLWSDGAQYNLARTYETQGKYAEAAALLEKGTSSQQHGNRLRGQRMKSLLKAPSK
jgi:tetratricopeptide (TPR) repeat protein